MWPFKKKKPTAIVGVERTSRSPAVVAYERSPRSDYNRRTARPAKDGIEITEGMIAAGVRRLLVWDGVLDLEESRARAVVISVLEASLAEPLPERKSKYEL